MACLYAGCYSNLAANCVLQLANRVYVIMAYFFILEPVKQELEVKRSRFMGFLEPVAERSQAIDVLNRYRAHYPDAAHHCWAYAIGDPNSGGLQASSDDGEPGGTAGKPMLNVLQHKSLSDVMAVVVRYFGGVKLGTGGLVRAYSDTIQACVDSADQQGILQMREARIELWLHFEYANESGIRQLLSTFGASILACDYTETTNLKVSLLASDCEVLVDHIGNLCRGNIEVRPAE